MINIYHEILVKDYFCFYQKEFIDDLEKSISSSTPSKKQGHKEKMVRDWIKEHTGQQ